jgi:hypothetical protein
VCILFDVELVVIWLFMIPTGKEKARKRVIERREKHKKPLIPKPRGSASKSSGYKIQTAMGLKDNKNRYNRLSVSTFYLP